MEGKVYFSNFSQGIANDNRFMRRDDLQWLNRAQQISSKQSEHLPAEIMVLNRFFPEAAFTWNVSKSVLKHAPRQECLPNITIQIDYLRTNHLSP
jgi:hypothetical protein